MRLSLMLFLGTMMAAPSVVQASRRIPKPEDYLVKGLDKIEQAFESFHGQMFAGLVSTQLYETDKQDDGALMFWMFIPEKTAHEDSLTVWLNGGPGCSSMSGCLFEHCPVTIPLKPAGYFGIDPTKGLEPNKYAWTNANAMIYVENPHGAGFSTGVFPQNETDVGRDFYIFLQNLFSIFEGSSIDLRAKKLNFFGESYAGMYVPSIAHYIHQENKKKKLPHINLAGIGLGNGWIDARIQGPAVIDYAWWHGMIDSSAAKALKTEWDNCKDGSRGQPKPFHRFTIPDECGIMGALLEVAGKGAVDWGAPNAYDVSVWDLYEMLDYPEGGIMQFYNNPEVQDALHVPEHQDWNGCVKGAGRRRLDESFGKLPGQYLLADDRPESVVPYIAELLDDAGIRVLIYNGDRDLTTNSRGSEMCLDGMDWSGAEGWADPNKFDRGLWFTGTDEKQDDLAGYVKKYKNLEFIVVVNSGHLVPFNRPEVALDLITRFVGGEGYVDKTLPSFSIKPKSRSEYDETDDGKFKNAETKSHLSGLFSTIVLVICSFFAGVWVSRRFPRKRHDYETIGSEGLALTSS